MEDLDGHADDVPQLYADHLLLLRGIWFDNRKPDEGYNLLGVVTTIRPAEGYNFPIRLKRLFVYFQVWGDLGDYRFRIRLVRCGRDEDNEEIEIQLGEDGDPMEFPMPTTRYVELTTLSYIQEVAFPINDVPFEIPSVYEIQLWADGIDWPLTRERISAQE